MGCTPSKSRRRDGLFFNDKDAESVDLLDDEDRPPQVRHFVFTNITPHSFDVAWKAQTNRPIERYQVRIFPPEGVRSRSLINSLQTPSYTFERLKSGTRYTVGVVAFDNTGKNSTCASASEATLPQPPTDLRFPSRNISSSIFRAVWKPSLGDRDYYEISITPTDGVTGETFVSELQETHHIFTGLVPGTDYRVTVVSVANDRKSEALEGTVVTNPGHVYDLTFPHVTQNEMQLVWKPPLGRVECYTVTLSSEREDEEPVEIHKIKQTSYRFNGLVTGRNYQCEIYTHAHGKTSLKRVFPQCTIPSEVTGLSATNISTTEATISWTTAPGDADDYDLFLNPKDQVQGKSSPRGIEGNSHTFKGLTAGTKYTVGVVTNSKDKISQRAVVAFLTEPAPCGDITFPKEDLKSTQIRVRWSPAEGQWDSYSILVMKDAGAGGTWKQDEITQTEYLFTELTPGAEYTFNITTNSEGRQSSETSASCSTLPCPAGTIAFPVNGITSNSIKVIWTPSAGGVDSYKIRAKGEDFNFEDDAGFGKSDYVISGLSPGTKYEISVSVVSYGIESEPSVETCMTGPSRVNDLESQTLSKNKIRVSWSPPKGGADSYSIRISPDEGMDCKLHPTSTQEPNHTFDRLIPGMLYQITVTPMARCVNGPADTIDGYTTPGDILNVYVPADEITNDSMKLVWRVEGDSKQVLVTLLKENAGGNTVVISENAVYDSSHTFTGLEKNIRYIVKLRAIGSHALASAGGEGAKGSETSIIHDTRTEQPPEPSNPNSTESGTVTGDIVDSPPVVEVIEYVDADVTPTSTFHDTTEIAAARVSVTRHDETALREQDGEKIQQDGELNHVETPTTLRENVPTQSAVAYNDPTDHTSSNPDVTAELSAPVEPPSDQPLPSEEDGIAIHRTEIDSAQ